MPRGEPSAHRGQHCASGRCATMGPCPPPVRSRSSRPDADEVTLLAQPWVTIVWNDPVNLMSYVTFVFQKYFGYSKTKAEKLMMEVHNDGKSVVSHGQPRGDGARRPGDARVRPVGHDAEGRRDDRERLRAAPAQRARASPPSPASRPTCCARWPRQLVELLRNEAADRRERRPTRSRRCSTSPARRPSPTTRCWRGCSRRRTPTTRRPPASSGASPRARLRDGKADAAVAIIDALEEAGLPPSCRGRPVDRRRARPGAPR